jgi:hypothetical protein
MASKKFTLAEARALVEKADAAGKAEAEKTRPTPMLVGTPKNMMASLTGGDDGGFDETQPVYYVPQGVCGFAWITIKPATGSFVRRLREMGLGSAAYGGGWQIWVGKYGQSMELKEAYARGFARVLQEAGIKAYADSRMD